MEDNPPPSDPCVTQPATASPITSTVPTNAGDIAASSPPEVYYSLDEVKKHNKRRDLWMAIRGFVYDLSYFEQHPGGDDVLVMYSGRLIDCNLMMLTATIRSG